MSFDHAYSEWCAALNRIGFAVESFLNARADDAEIEALQASIGFALPDDLKALYRKANGQVPPFGLKDASPGRIVTPFFGFYDFISLQKALSNYNLWRGIYEEAGESFHADFNEGIIAVRNSDPVHAEYWRPGWLPFSIDGGGNSYAVDLSPPPNGTYGQVIVIGSDEDERRVLASSLTELLSSAATHRLELSEGDGIFQSFDLERLTS